MTSTTDKTAEGSGLTRKDFHHPFPPYEIQQQFMETLYNCIEQGNVGIFESPTGTGKSLSLICGALTWLREHKQRQFDETTGSMQPDDDEPDWMHEHAKEARRREMRQMRDDFEARLSAVRERERQLKARLVGAKQLHKRRKRESNGIVTAVMNEDQYLLDDYDDDVESCLSSLGQSEYSSETTKLMEQLGMLPSHKQSENSDVHVDELKIFFCSRTHSQLSQLVGELQRVHLPPSMPPDPGGIANAVEELKHLSLGSRKNLCINPKVSQLSNQTAINERCLELQQPSTSSEHKCPFLPKKENEDLVLEFRDHAMSKVHDIEDLADVGRRLGICPYYASRAAIAPAEIVTLPYPLLLQKSARESLGISLKSYIVIIDEAHNLMSAIEAIASVQISDVQLKRARECMMVYLAKFRNRLKGSNRVYCTQVVRVIDAMMTCTVELGKADVNGGTVDPGALLRGNNVDQINTAKLVHYIGESKIARKVDGYVCHLAEINLDKDGKDHAASETPVLTQVQNFLTTLLNPSKEGRFFWSRDAGTVTIRYMLLHPSEHFRDIVEDARAVILAGGTMSPMDEYRQQLFPYRPSLTTFSCGHLISTTSLFVRAITSDKQGRLDFSFKSRSDPSIALRIGHAIINIARQVKGGLVIFFPSYGFLEQMTKSWQASSILKDLDSISPVHIDGRTASAEETFKAYSIAIHTGDRGAVMLSVVGGKLSEGINFSDDLGRCVVVVGLPFPNFETPEWKAKLRDVDDRAVGTGGERGKASREFAENVCMRSVNQAVGRVIRHKDDWASILLMDGRYGDDRMHGKLPGWIRESFDGAGKARMGSVEDVVGGLGGFFGERK